MPDALASRKSRFRAALALAGMTAGAWAEENGVTASHLSQVLNGSRVSVSLLEKVDAFAERYLAPVAA